jgi:hypothetical protein
VAPTVDERSGTMPRPGQPAYAIQAADEVQVLDPSGSPSPLIIKSTDPFKVAMEFTILSPLVCIPLLSYEVKYFAESIGEGPEYNLGTVTKQTQAGQYTYNATTPAGSETVLDVPADKMDAGVYRLAATVSFKLACPPNTPPTPYGMTAYSEGPAIQVYA